MFKGLTAIIVFIIIIYGIFKKVNVYECFVEGAKEGIYTALKIFPYLLAMIIAVSIFRGSLALNFLNIILEPITSFIGIPKELMPLILIKPLSGSGALGVFMDILKQYGADSYIGRVASIIMGSSETIFYTITIYYGAVGIKKIRHTLLAAVIADFSVIIIAIFLTNLVFGYN